MNNNNDNNLKYEHNYLIWSVWCLYLTMFSRSGYYFWVVYQYFSCVRTKLDFAYLKNVYIKLLLL